MRSYDSLQIVKDVLTYLSCVMDLVILLKLAIMYVFESKFGKRMMGKNKEKDADEKISATTTSESGQSCDKVINKNISLEAYYELSPVNDLGEKEEQQETFRALDFALFKDEIHNIAIAGPYGSGKSSVWESYKKRRMEEKKFPYSLNDLLEISLAKFTELNDNHLNGCGKNEQSVAQDDKEKEEFDLERGILQQIVFSVESEDIPKSKIQKIVDYSKLFYLGMGFSLIGLYGWKIKDYVDFVAKYIEELVNCGIFFEKIINISVPIEVEYIIWSIVFFVSPTIVYIIASICIFGFVRRIPSLCLSKISFKDLDIDFDERKGSLINQNITELIYFFERTGKKIVVFEDIDRNKSNTIFVKLRELNRILNRCPKLFGKIKFIYMVRDDILPKYERTKFFDFIVPIVPVLNGDNAAQCMKKMFLKDSGSLVGDKPCFSSEYIKKIGKYVEDMRLVKNCFNEFRVYKKKNIEFLGDVGDEKLFSLILYKNLYPKDFQKLLKHEGVLYYCLNEAVKNFEKMNDDNSEKEGGQNG